MPKTADGRSIKRCPSVSLHAPHGWTAKNGHKMFCEGMSLSGYIKYATPVVPQIKPRTTKEQVRHLARQCEDGGASAADLGLTEISKALRSIEVNLLRQIADGMFDKDD